MAANIGKTNKSKLLSRLIMEKLTNPLDRLKEERKELVIRVNELTAKIDLLEQEEQKK